MKKHELDVDIHQYPEAMQNTVCLFMDEDGLVRTEARKKMVAKGNKSLSILEKLLESEVIQVRWESVKAMEEIADRTSIDTFIRLMEHDPESDVREVATHGLARFGKIGIVPLLEKLIQGRKHSFLYETAALTFRKLGDEYQKSHPAIHELVDALLSSEVPDETVPNLAEKVLRQIDPYR
ncbi:HEAT repeat domain-containing protein [Fulvitalea axinellae]